MAVSPAASTAQAVDTMGIAPTAGAACQGEDDANIVLTTQYMPKIVCNEINCVAMAEL